MYSVYRTVCTWNDTITKHYGFPAISFSSNGNSMNGWSSANWGTTTSHYVSAPTSITNSPFGNYSSNFDNKLLCLPAIDLTASTDATLFLPVGRLNHRSIMRLRKLPTTMDYQPGHHFVENILRR